ncbi:MAG: hypothetical protein ACRDSZ_14435 [Pseudonocardiaceae bacterium]
MTKREIIEMVNVRGLIAHFLSAGAAAAGRGGGRYVALCGAEVIPASPTALPKGFCRTCSTALAGQRTR